MVRGVSVFDTGALCAIVCATWRIWQNYLGAAVMQTYITYITYLLELLQVGPLQVSKNRTYGFNWNMHYTGHSPC